VRNRRKKGKQGRTELKKRRIVEKEGRPPPPAPPRSSGREGRTSLAAENTREPTKKELTEENREGNQRLAPLHGEEEEKTAAVPGFHSHRPPFKPPPVGHHQHHHECTPLPPSSITVSATRFAPHVAVHAPFPCISLFK
jgi:hypothetical protein